MSGGISRFGIPTTCKCQRDTEIQFSISHWTSIQYAVVSSALMCNIYLSASEIVCSTWRFEVASAKAPPSDCTAPMPRAARWIMFLPPLFILLPLFNYTVHTKATISSTINNISSTTQQLHKLRQHASLRHSHRRIHGLCALHLQKEGAQARLQAIQLCRRGV